MLRQIFRLRGCRPIRKQSVCTDNVRLSGGLRLFRGQSLPKPEIGLDAVRVFKQMQTAGALPETELF